MACDLRMAPTVTELRISLGAHLCRTLPHHAARTQPGVQTPPGGGPRTIETELCACAQSTHVGDRTGLHVPLCPLLLCPNHRGPVSTFRTVASALPSRSPAEPTRTHPKPSPLPEALAPEHRHGAPSRRGPPSRAPVATLVSQAGSVPLVGEQLMPRAPHRPCPPLRAHV